MDFDINKDKIPMKKNGKIVECDILFTFDSEDTGKVYVGYSDHSIASNGRKNIYVSSYDPIIGINSLEDITDERELAMVRQVLAQIDKESRM